MKIVSIYSETHKPLAKLLAQSAVVHLPPGSEIDLAHVGQACPSGVFNEPGWKDAVVQKYHVLLDRMRGLDEGEWLMFVDADVTFFADPVAAFGEYVDPGEVEMAFQSDGRGLCSGAFYAKNCPDVRWVFESVIETIGESRIGDQLQMMTVLESGKRDVRYSILPNVYSNLRNIGYRGKWRAHMWKHGERFPVSSDMVLFHANWCKGVEAKLELTRAARILYGRARKESQDE